MITVLDTNFLIAFLNRDKDVDNLISLQGEKISHQCLRIEAAIDHFEERNITALIPAPVLAELLINYQPSDFQTIVDSILDCGVFKLANFDVVAALELAKLTGENEKKQMKTPGETKAKLVVDRQVIAIAKANKCTTIHTQDRGLAKKAKSVGITATCLSQYQAVMKRTLPLI